MPALGQKEKTSKYQSISKRNLKLDRSVPDLLKEAEAIMVKDPATALDRVEEALALSITQKSVFNEGLCYLQLGKINQVINQWELAVENYENAFKIFDASYQQTSTYLETVKGAAYALTQLRRHQESLSYSQLALAQASIPEQLAEIHLDMADSYYYLDDFTAAETSLANAETIIENNEWSLLSVRAQAIKAKILVQKDDIDAAEVLYQQNQTTDLGIANDELKLTDESLETSKEELINAYKKQDRVDEEINLRNQSIEANTRKGKVLKVVQEKQTLGRRFIETGQTYDAIKELTEAVELADSLGNDRELANAYRSLAEVWNKNGDKDNSLKYYQLYTIALDRLEDVNFKEEKKKGVLLKKQQDISSLTKELALDESQNELQRTSTALQGNRLKLQQFVIYALLLLLTLAIISSWFIYRNAKRSKTRGQLLALKSLRSQMNPHFIFNALNSVNQFIALNDERAANKFLSDFSKLMRLVLDNSQMDFITLTEEKEILALYLKLEHNRFRDKFEYEFNIDEEISLDTIEVPPMLIQPYIENAIWHGLRYKEDKGNLIVSLKLTGEVLIIEIIDDGIGRKKSKELKTTHQKKHLSTGLKNIEERIHITNQLYQKNYTISVNDVDGDGTGTHVKLMLPQNG